MSTYEQLPRDPLVLVSCTGTYNDRKWREEVSVNLLHHARFNCTEVLNQYHKRGYSVASHNLVHEAPGLLSDGYFVGTWTMVQPVTVESSTTGS